MIEGQPTVHLDTLYVIYVKVDDVTYPVEYYEIPGADDEYWEYGMLLVDAKNRRCISFPFECVADEDDESFINIIKEKIRCDCWDYDYKDRIYDKDFEYYKNMLKEYDNNNKT